MADQQQRDFAANTSRGIRSLAVSALVILGLYIIPRALGLDVTAALGEQMPVGILRIALGALVLLGLFAFLRGLLRASTLEGETLAQGLRNLVNSPLFASELVGIALLLAGGIALIALGLSSLLA